MSDQSKEVIFWIRSLKKLYQDRCVLDIDRFLIYRNEITGIIGPSGSGKSTLLRIMNFLESPSEGGIEYMGAHFSHDNEMPLSLRRRITTVFQHPILLNRNVKENIAFALRLHGKKASDEVIHHAIKEVGLEKLSNQRARTLSAGEAQRVALARAMVIQPQVILFDEPTANLDPMNVMLIENIIQQMRRDLGMTIVLVTHNLFQAKRLADRVAFLYEGKIIEVNTANKMFQNPADPRTQAFILGDMVY